MFQARVKDESEWRFLWKFNVVQKPKAEKGRGTSPDFNNYFFTFIGDAIFAIFVYRW